MDMESLEGIAVRAIDVGYGNVKLTLSHTDAFGPIVCDIFPSRSPVASDKGLAAGLLLGRDTAIININGTDYEVGKGVAKAQGTNNVSEVLDKDFCLSDAYMARLRGAFHYMLGKDKHGTPHLAKNNIGMLVVGLPVSTFRSISIRAKLREKLLGEHLIDEGRSVVIEHVVVMPQPMGAFFEYAFENSMFDKMKDQTNLVIDPGYFTFDWLLSSGITPIDGRSDSVNRGMSAVMRAIVEVMKKKEEWEAQTDMLIRMLDDHFREGKPFIVYGEEVDVSQYIHAGRGIINEAVAALANNVGDGADVQNIILTGGGAKLYLDAVQEKFPRHKILVMESPVYSNVRGFQLAGERQVLGMLRKQRKDAMAVA